MSSLPPELPGVRHEYVQAGGLRTHVALAGPEDGAPVVLVHGWPQHWWSWREVIPALAEAGRRVIIPDLRGHGWTEKPRGGYDKEGMAGDLLALLDALSLGDGLTWVGHDWGAYIGFLVALRAPERLERMLTLSIPHLWARRDPRLVPVMLAYQGPISLPFVGPRVADPILRRVLQSGRGGQRLSQADVDLFAENIPPATTVAVYRTFLTRELSGLMRGRYARRRLEVPTTLIAGEKDLVTTGLSAGPVPGQPNLSVELLPDVAHWVPEQRPDAVVRWVLEGSGA
jgi:pimeloyl-ACP methyl ester carboxylesterase